MFGGKKILHKGFARLSPVFVALGCVLTVAAAAPGKTAAKAAATAAVRRQSASTQFARAEEQRAALNSKATEKRTLADYKLVVTGYRRVALITPRASEVPDSLLAVAELYTEMGDRFGRSYYQSAADSYQFLVREYPTSRYCQDATLRAAQLQNGDATNGVTSNSTNASPTAEDVRANAPVHFGGKSVGRPGSREIPRVRMIRADANGDTTRVTIDLEDSVQYASGRIANPERIFFDLHAARLMPEVARGNVRVDGGLLTAVRAAIGKRGQEAVVEDSNESAVAASGARTVQDAAPKGMGTDADSASEQRAENSQSAISGAIGGGATGDGVINDAGAVNNSSAVAGNSLPGAKSTKSKSIKATTSSAKPDLIRPASTPQPTRDGQSTLTRALGLKIGRIVIDAGHGGHDTGTIGPTGLMEKDLCLDVALRLGKIIEQRLPGADVVYTRSDDSFIPLEERTNIANQAKADLFISIHANSSRDHAARGIETYYLNLKGSVEAMEVAARENATAQGGVHELQDLVLKIARTEKIDESKELAEDIQDSLSKRIQKTNKPVKHRGVRKAPFVVLIGADMPSILTEISFLSNPADEQMLKKPEQRQKGD